ncbi:hypothetical protein RHODOSMS8_01814 [Rhodobiaceae bacterium]|nr:hypothetical protein RHODOSMS8_01814 [Rhodobiaceae bacterium]
MPRKLKFVPVAIAALIGLGAGGAAIAHSNEGSSNDVAESRAFLSSSGSLSNAVAAAENETGARAMSADFGEEDGVFVYEIELLKPDGTELEAKVNAQNYSVLKVETEESDAADNDSDEDEDEDESDHD